MKKLALLLAALSVASVSYAKEVMPEAAPVVEEAPVVEQEVVEVKAAPVLRVTSVGQTLKVEDTSNTDGTYGHDIGEAIHLENRVGLALGDSWTFDLMARKTWEASVDDYLVNDTEGSGMKSAGHRLDLQATRHFENFSVGLRWRGEQEKDMIFLPLSYNYGMVSGWFDPAYTFYDNGNDSFYLEAEPIQLTYGPFQLAYYFEGEKWTGDLVAAEGRDDHFYSHQAILRATLFQNDTFKVGAEYAYQFADEAVYEEVGYEEKLENNKHVAKLSLAYNVSENLVVDTYYEYNFNKYEETVDGKEVPVDDDYKGKFGLGWTYNF